MKIAFGACLLFFNVSTLFGQTNATIRGSIKNQSGAVLPGVAITVRNEATGIERMTLSDESGNDQVAALPVGIYKIEAMLPRMKPALMSGLALEVGHTVIRDFKLEVGAVSEQVSVAADPAAVETSTISVGEVTSPKTVQEIPLNGRHFLDMGFLIPGR